MLSTQFFKNSKNMKLKKITKDETRTYFTKIGFFDSKRHVGCPIIEVILRVFLLKIPGLIILKSYHPNT